MSEVARAVAIIVCELREVVGFGDVTGVNPVSVPEGYSAWVFRVIGGAIQPDPHNPDQKTLDVLRETPLIEGVLLDPRCLSREEMGIVLGYTNAVIWGDGYEPDVALAAAIAQGMDKPSDPLAMDVSEEEMLRRFAESGF